MKVQVIQVNSKIQVQVIVNLIKHIYFGYIAGETKVDVCLSLLYAFVAVWRLDNRHGSYQDKCER